MKKLRLATTCVVLAMLFCFVAQASLVLPVNIKQHAKLSEHIFKGQCLGKKTELDTYESGKLVTYYTFKVSDWIKGESWSDSDVVVFKQLAQGTFHVDGHTVRQNLYGPEYEIGKTYLLFLPRPSEEGLLFPMGLFQGAYVIETDENGNETMPQLKSRQKLLKSGLDNGQNKFLRFQLSTLETDSSYGNFKSLIQSAMESDQ